VPIEAEGDGERLGRSFVEALGRKDAEALKLVLHPEVEFRAMTPGRFWEADDAARTVDHIFLGRWFSASDVITETVAVETATVGRRARVGYCFRVNNPDGVHLVEQQAYLEADGDQITWLRIMCAGYQLEDANDAT
jgi:hypothetical protein